MGTIQTVWSWLAKGDEAKLRQCASIPDARLAAQEDGVIKAIRQHPRVLEFIKQKPEETLMPSNPKSIADLYGWENLTPMTEEEIAALQQDSDKGNNSDTQNDDDEEEKNKTDQAGGINWFLYIFIFLLISGGVFGVYWVFFRKSHDDDYDEELEEFSEIEEARAIPLEMSMSGEGERVTVTVETQPERSAEGDGETGETAPETPPVPVTDVSTESSNRQRAQTVVHRKLATESSQSGRKSSPAIVVTVVKNAPPSENAPQDHALTRFKRMTSRDTGYR